MHSRNEPEIAGLITRLMAHYWTAQEPEALRRSIAADWLEDLAEFGPAVVADACRQWRRTGHRRPLPSDIRTLCIAEQAARREHRLAIANHRQPWPHWLAELWGPAPDGPRRRAEAVARDKDRTGRAGAATPREAAE